MSSQAREGGNILEWVQGPGWGVQAVWQQTGLPLRHQEMGGTAGLTWGERGSYGRALWPQANLILLGLPRHLGYNPLLESAFHVFLLL